MRRTQPSLKARLILRQLVLQFLAIAVAAIGLVAYFVNSELDGMYADEGIAEVAANSIGRSTQGSLTVGVTPEMAELQNDSPDLWFGARLSDGSVITYGEVPPESLLFCLISTEFPRPTYAVHHNLVPYLLTSDEAQ